MLNKAQQIHFQRQTAAVGLPADIPHVVQVELGAAQEMDQIMAEFALCMKNGETPDSAEAQHLVKQLQNHITENYYSCTTAILAGLGQMYVADERFRNNIDKHADGTAQFICEAIGIYCGK